MWFYDSNNLNLLIMTKDNFITQIQASSGNIPCDIVLKNATVIDVFQNSTFVSNVAIKNGYIVGLGEYSGTEEIDCTGKYICPGLIDAHAHIESSLTTPDEYYRVALLHGITSLVADPHEIANVLGTKGIDLMLSLSSDIPFDFYFMLPSCVPATSFESSGAVLEQKDLVPYYSNSKVIGLAEVMDNPAVLNTSSSMIDKLWDCKSKGYVIDGHCASFNERQLNAYATANVSTDHEAHTAEGVIDRLRRGLYVLIREGTVAKNLKDLIKVTSIENSRRVCLCTDDKHIDDIIINGSIDASVKMCIEYGLKPSTAIQMATLNTSECYRLRNKGAIAPGYIADFLILDNLEKFEINSVYKNGTLVVKDNKLVNIPKRKEISNLIKNTINIPNITSENLNINTSSSNVLNAIEVIPNRLETNLLKVALSDNKDSFIADLQNDLLKLAVIERHNNTGNIGLGVVHGFKLKYGAIATTISHDSHNIIATGTNDSDIIFAINALKDLGGGIIVVKDNEILASVQLEIAGLITSRTSEEVIKDLEKLHKAIEIIAPDISFNPFLTLSFLSLPVIPDIKITDKGLFDVTKFEFIPLCTKE